jgi:hypothetical protein
MTNTIINVTIKVTGDNLYRSYNPKKYSSPWVFSTIQTGIEHASLGKILSIRRHTNKTYTLTCEKGKITDTIFTIKD